MKSKCSLEEFVRRARELHEGRVTGSNSTAAGGVKRTRLLLRLRPKDSRKTFVLKITDGENTFSTKVDHYGQLPLVERIITDFVNTCTAEASSR